MFFSHSLPVCQLKHYSLENFASDSLQLPPSTNLRLLSGSCFILFCLLLLRCSYSVSSVLVCQVHHCSSSCHVIPNICYMNVQVRQEIREGHSKPREEHLQMQSCARASLECAGRKSSP